MGAVERGTTVRGLISSCSSSARSKPASQRGESASENPTRQRVPTVSSRACAGAGAGVSAGVGAEVGAGAGDGLDAVDAVDAARECKSTERAVGSICAPGRLTATAVSVRNGTGGAGGSTCALRRRSLASQPLNVVACRPCAAQYAACV